MLSGVAVPNLVAGGKGRTPIDPNHKVVNLGPASSAVEAEKLIYETPVVEGKKKTKQPSVIYEYYCPHCPFYSTHKFNRKRHVEVVHGDLHPITADRGLDVIRKGEKKEPSFLRKLKLPGDSDDDSYSEETFLTREKPVQPIAPKRRAGVVDSSDASDSQEEEVEEPPKKKLMGKRVSVANPEPVARKPVKQVGKQLGKPVAVKTEVGGPVAEKTEVKKPEIRKQEKGAVETGEKQQEPGEQGPTGSGQPDQPQERKVLPIWCGDIAIYTRGAITVHVCK